MGHGPSRFERLMETLPQQSGKTFVITGTTSGTGNTLAHALGRLGADTVIMLNRPSSRADAALEELKAAHAGTKYVHIDCDLQDFASVRTAADAVQKAASGGIDVLCNNAGIMAFEDVATKDGYDVQMQTNHLSHFLLTKRLFPLLEKAAEARGEARVVNHSSIARNSPKRPLEEQYLRQNGGNLGGNGATMGSGARWVRYQQTKLANCVFTFALHERLKQRGSKVKALVAHPGLSKTNLQVSTHQQGGFSLLQHPSLLMRVAQSQEDGTMGILRCCVDPECQSGQFYGPAGAFLSALSGNAVLLPTEPTFDNPAPQDMLWRASNDAVGEEFEL